MLRCKKETRLLSHLNLQVFARLKCKFLQSTHASAHIIARTLATKYAPVSFQYTKIYTIKIVSDVYT